MSSDGRVITEKNFRNFVDDLIAHDEREVVGVQSKGSKYVFDHLDSAEDLELEYDVTILPPKKYFMPQREKILEYEIGGDDFSVNPVVEVKPRIIIGIHPYDLIAIEQLDKIFADNYEDDNYLAKREECVLIGVNMQEVSEWSFAGCMGAATTDSGYDLMLTELDGEYVVEIGSAKGNDLLEGVSTREAKPEDLDKMEKAKEDLRKKFEKELNFPPEELPDLLGRNYDNMEFWKKNSEKCYSCASCNLVCPTCYCFDVEDLNEINMQEGERKRRWDGCLLEEFAVVAGGENFRRTKAERYRHRFMRKGKYIPEKYGFIACVGCGRCGSHCIPDIADPSRIYNKLKEEEQ